MCRTKANGRMSQALVLECVMANELTLNGRAVRNSVIRRFSVYHAAFDPLIDSHDRRALPRSRAVEPPRILS